MIGKSRVGSGFSGCFRYVMGEKKLKPGEKDKEAHIIGGNMMGRNSRELSSEVRPFRQQRPDIEKPVWHMPVAFHPNEKMTDAQMQQACEKFLDRMGIDKERHQYVITRHHDEPQAHAHIVVNRIGMDGKVLDLWRDRHRVKAATREVERELNLRQTIEKAEPYKEDLRSQIRDTARQSKTMPEFAKGLKAKGIETTFSYRLGQLYGITYKVEGYRVHGSKLGREYSFQGVQGHLGVNYIQSRDEAQLRGGFAGDSKARPGQNEQDYMRGQISAVARQETSFSDFCDELRKRDIKTEIGYRRGQPSKVSYRYGDTQISGKQLGDGYTFKGLQEQGVTYEPRRDDERLKAYTKNRKTRQQEDIIATTQALADERSPFQERQQQSAQVAQQPTSIEIPQYAPERRGPTPEQERVARLAERVSRRDSVATQPKREPERPQPIQTGERQIYRAEQYDIERVGRADGGYSLTISDKQGNTIQASTVDRNGHRTITLDNTDHTASFDTGQVRRKHAEIFEKAEDATWQRDIKAIQKDSTGIQQVEKMGELAPEGSHAIATAHLKLSESRRDRVQDGKYSYRRTKDGYEVRQLDSGKLVAQSNKDGIRGRTEAHEKHYFKDAYQGAARQKQAAIGFERYTTATNELIGRQNPSKQEHTSIASDRLARSSAAQAMDKPRDGTVYRAEDYRIEKEGSQGRIYDKQGNELFSYSVDRSGGLTVHKDDITSNEQHQQTFEQAYQATQSKQELDGILKDKTGERQVSELGSLAPEGSRAIQQAYSRGSGYDESYRYERNDDGYKVYERASGDLVARSGSDGIEGKHGHEFQAPQASTPSQAQNKVVYKAEDYRIEREGETTSIFDKDGQKIFQYEGRADGEYRIELDRISGNAQHEQAFAKAHANIQSKDLGATLKDSTGRQQVNQLGNLAPQGSHAIANAHQKLQGRERIMDSKYNYQRTEQGYEVQRREDKQVIAQSDERGVQSPEQSQQDLNHFKQSLAQEHARAQNREKTKEIKGYER